MEPLCSSCRIALFCGGALFYQITVVVYTPEALFESPAQDELDYQILRLLFKLLDPAEITEIYIFGPPLPLLIDILYAYDLGVLAFRYLAETLHRKVDTGKVDGFEVENRGEFAALLPKLQPIEKLPEPLETLFSICLVRGKLFGKALNLSSLSDILSPY